ncbi:hypothetical protein VTL71DRAFT_10371 [Oculimacula yallundae]|uniref:2EXR domain-containing protein n=1 Tax=Oculimacula yallundae TaxID=86028 RepID=A0ABR4CTD0_9HELO
MSSVAPNSAHLDRLINPPAPLLEFHKFPELPGELRTAIWDLVKCEPRNIRVVIDGVIDGMISRKKGVLRRGDKKYTLKGVCSVPPMLQVCSESRCNALRRYSLVFETRFCGRPVYINWNQDSIYFVSPKAIDAFFLPRAGPPLRPEGREEIALFKGKCRYMTLGHLPRDFLRFGRILPQDMPKLDRFDLSKCDCPGNILCPWDLKQADWGFGREANYISFLDRIRRRIFPPKYIPLHLVFRAQSFMINKLLLTPTSPVLAPGNTAMASLLTNTAAARPAQIDRDQVAQVVELSLFPKFPKELRLHIIEEAIEESVQRTFLICQNGVVHVKRRKNYPAGFQEAIKVTKLPVPAFLHVNAEFRTAALKTYDLVFSGSLINKPIYFNFAKDTLFFCSLSDLEVMYRTTSHSAWKKIEQKLRHMIINDEFHGNVSALMIIAHFHKLKVFGHRTHEESTRAWRNTGNDARLKSVLEGNWLKNREHEHCVAAANRSMALIPEATSKEVYELPRIDALSYAHIDGMII